MEATHQITSNIERIEDRDEHPDFVGLFERITAFYRQSSNFFGCGRGWIHGRRRP
ncbi:hypothetical protein [Thiolapillus sp.]|uniref:hypothetical protein n=1 Tax=Thiolapillus sp. TaxID=2017437 RepID=UPI003AF85983